MVDASNRMGTLITDLLAYSRVTTKGQPFEQVELVQLSKEVVSDLEVKLEEVGGRVEIGELPSIEADPMQMRQLMQNLIGNATDILKKDEGVITVGCEKKDDALVITCADNGPGIPEDMQACLFDAFTSKGAPLEKSRISLLIFGV